MSFLPDINCYVKAIQLSTSKVIPNGSSKSLYFKDGVIFRYVVANDSDRAAGPLTISCALTNDGQNVPLNLIPIPTTIKPKTVWTFDHTVGAASGKYVASIVGDVGNKVDEEDESNNSYKLTINIKEEIG